MKKKALFRNVLLLILFMCLHIQLFAKPFSLPYQTYSMQTDQNGIRSTAKVLKNSTVKFTLASTQYNNDYVFNRQASSSNVTNVTLSNDNGSLSLTAQFGNSVQNNLIVIKNNSNGETVLELTIPTISSYNLGLKLRIDEAMINYIQFSFDARDYKVKVWGSNDPLQYNNSMFEKPISNIEYLGELNWNPSYQLYFKSGITKPYLMFEFCFSEDEFELLQIPSSYTGNTFNSISNLVEKKKYVWMMQPTMFYETDNLTNPVILSIRNVDNIGYSLENNRSCGNLIGENTFKIAYLDLNAAYNISNQIRRAFGVYSEIMPINNFGINNKLYVWSEYGRNIHDDTVDPNGTADYTSYYHKTAYNGNNFIKIFSDDIVTPFCTVDPLSGQASSTNSIIRANHNYANKYILHEIGHYIQSIHNDNYTVRKGSCGRWFGLSDSEEKAFSEAYANFFSLVVTSTNTFNFDHCRQGNTQSLQYSYNILNNYHYEVINSKNYLLSDDFKNVFNFYTNPLYKFRDIEGNDQTETNYLWYYFTKRYNNYLSTSVFQHLIGYLFWDLYDTNSETVTVDYSDPSFYQNDVRVFVDNFCYPSNQIFEILNNSLTVSDFISNFSQNLSPSQKTDFYSYCDAMRFQYPREISYNESLPQNYRLSSSLTVNQGATLTIPDNSIIVFGDNAKIEVNGNIVFGNNVQIIGTNVNNHITINGSVTIGNNLTLSSENSIKWSGLIIKNQAENININQINVFNTCLSLENSKISLLTPEFNNSYIYTNNTKLSINNGSLISSAINATSPLFGLGMGELIISNSSFNLEYETNAFRNRGVSLLNIPNYKFENNQFTNCNGIYIHNSGWGNTSIIQGNIFTGISDNPAVELYSSKVTSIAQNTFSDNQIALQFRNNSYTDVKNKGNDQIFQYSTYEHILSDHNSFPLIVTENIFEEMSDHVEIRCQNHTGTAQHDMTFNTWSRDFIDTTHMDPFNAFEYDPMNKIGASTFSDSLQYVEDLINEQYYDEAKTLLKNFITSSQDSWKQDAAIKFLFSLYLVGKFNFIEYYQYLESLQINTFTVSDYSNKAKVNINELEEPIHWLNDRINYSESVMDSTYANIDLSLINLYNMYKDSESLTYETLNQWAENTTNLLNTLDANVDIPDNTTINNPFIYNVRNYPNPFNPVTTISYSLKSDTNIKIKLYNVKGQLVDTVFEGLGKKGHNSIKWDSKKAQKITSGVYFYRISSIEGEITKKFILLK